MVCLYTRRSVWSFLTSDISHSKSLTDFLIILNNCSEIMSSLHWKYFTFTGMWSELNLGLGCFCHIFIKNICRIWKCIAQRKSFWEKSKHMDREKNSVNSGHCVQQHIITNILRSLFFKEEKKGLQQNLSPKMLVLKSFLTLLWKKVPDIFHQGHLQSQNTFLRTNIWSHITDFQTDQVHFTNKIRRLLLPIV